jgi:tetratricopeptide (TPR) repeat protein
MSRRWPGQSDGWSGLRAAAAAAAIFTIAALADVSSQEAQPVFRPALKTPEALAPYLAHVEAGTDAFASERDAEAIEARLTEVGGWLRGNGRQPDVPAGLFAPGFRGGRLWDRSQLRPAGQPIQITRGAGTTDTPSLDQRGMVEHLRALVSRLGSPQVTEFLVTAITPVPVGPVVPTRPPGEVGAVAPTRPLAPASEIRTEIRAEIVGSSGDARASYVATWRMTWRHAPTGWQVVEWTAGAQVTSHVPTPIFREITAAALATSTPAAQQFSTRLDAWNARLDSVLTRDSNGHHGVSVGDADGDGLEDLYVAQPSGLPNRLLRARGDGTFEDATERSGLGLLDDTAQSLFADVDNDGDQDLVVATSLQPLLFVNDGGGRFSIADQAFTFAAPLQGMLTGVTMADFDRDGFLDAYLCVYSYFFGAGEDKAGTPMPYHDARNGPPGVLFRNDGRGRFVDVTAQVGLDAGNDRYHFAAAWGDIDEDGWPDLFVANDFGTKNLYRNLGKQNGMVRFEDVATKAGVLDHGAGMSAAFLDYDNDGRLDIYAGNMWSAAGQRVTNSPAFMPDAPPEIREKYRHHARGNSLFRNRGDGTFEDRSVEAGVTMGRWAWSSDTLDFDSDGWQDLYIANGMLSRGDGRTDLDGYFWRQVVARSPLTPLKGTPYDEAWGAINQLLVHGSIASRQRNVLLRNDGQGAFDDVSGAVGLDLDQDGRSFAVLDLDRDGDPDLAVMAARQTPQLRVFRNDHPTRASIAIRLTGTTSNRDAIGARVRVETDVVRNLKLVQAGSGFLSQHSRELLFGLGDSRIVRRLTVAWPSGKEQVFTDLPVGTRYRLVEGGALEREPLLRPAEGQTLAAPKPTDGVGPTAERSRPTVSGSQGDLVPPKPTGEGGLVPPKPTGEGGTWFYEPFPAPAFTATALDGTTQSLATFKGRPAIVLFWRGDEAAGRNAVTALARGRARLDAARVGVLAVALDDAEAAARVKAASPAGVPIVHATREQGLLWAIVYRHLFMNRQPMPLPTTLLFDGAGRIVRAYRGAVDAERIAADAAAIDGSDAERLTRALPFAGSFHLTLSQRNFLPYGRELLDEGFEVEAIDAFERASQANPSAPVLYRLGTLLAKAGQIPKARAAFEGALTLDPSLSEAHNDLGALVAQTGDLDGAIARFRLALTTTPDYPDALNNLGYALLLAGKEAEARPLYERALALQPDFPEALNNLGLLLGRAGDLDGAERQFRQALERRPDYGDAANNLALVLVARGQETQAVAMLEDLLSRTPAFENAYVTIARIHFNAGRVAEGLQAVERLLQRNPTHQLGLALAREYRPR